MALCCSTGIPLAGWNLVLQFLILCGVQYQTQCSRCCLLSATHMATIPVWTFFNVRHHKDALLTYIQLVVQEESVSLFTKQLFSILSQVLNFVYLPILQLEFQSIGHSHVREYSNPSPWLLMKILWGISPCYWLLWTPLVNLPLVIVNLHSELLTLLFDPPRPGSFSPRRTI